MTNPCRPDGSFKVMTVIAATVLVVGGCSSAGRNAANEFPATTSTSTSTSTTTASTTTSMVATTEVPVPTTTSSTPVPAWTEEELAVIQAHDDFREAYFLVATQPDSELDLVQARTTPDYGSALVSVLMDLRSVGATFEGAYNYGTMSVEFPSADSALITTCVLDEMARVEGGRVVAQPQESAGIRQTRMELSAEGWQVAGANGAGTGEVGQPCEL